jgi:chitin disaccharide deacetylase
MPSSRQSLLIVNADDYGHDRAATDLTIECFGRGQLSSATAMMYMPDSERAAALALEHDLPTGLHLNFTEPFADPATPSAVRERQAEACRRIGHNLRLYSWIYDISVRSMVDDAIRDQAERFEMLFGRPPTHVDGHNHVQVCPNVALASTLPSRRIRNALWAWPERHTVMGAMRSLRGRLVNRRLQTTRYFADITETHRPGMDARRSPLLACSRQTSVEVMAHPGFAHELEALREPTWQEALADLALGSYRDIDGTR